MTPLRMETRRSKQPLVDDLPIEGLVYPIDEHYDARGNRRRRRLHLATWGTNARLVQAYNRADVEYAFPGHKVRAATDNDVEVFRQVVAS